MRIFTIIGARPQFIKASVVSRAIRKSEGIEEIILHTGQHFDDSLAAGVARDLALRQPDVQLDLGGLPRGAQIGRATDALTTLFAEDPPAAVIVQGDTNSGLAGALAANAQEVPLVHVEAGLRSHDRAMPEEHNRVLIDHIADICAAPTDAAADNLANEGIPGSRIAVTGNTVIEAVQRMVPDDARRALLRKEYGIDDGAFVLATVHRPENVDAEPALRAVLEGLVALDEPVLFPMHPRTAARCREFGLDALASQLHVVDPTTPSDFLGLAKEASLLVSDSGGVQEEVSVIKRPVLVVRRSTERPEALGTFAELIRPDQIAGRGAWYLHGEGADRDLTNTPSPFGDGSASRRIVDLVCESIGG